MIDRPVAPASTLVLIHHCNVTLHFLPENEPRHVFSVAMALTSTGTRRVCSRLVGQAELS